MHARLALVVALVLCLLGLGTATPAFAVADTTPPVLHGISLASPGPFTAGDTVTVQWDATDDAGIDQVQVGYLDAVGHEKVVYASGGAGSAQSLIDYRWADGPVTVRWVWLFDVNGNWSVYRPDGTWTAQPAASGTHAIDLHAAEFATQGTGQDITAPTLDTLSMQTPATRTAGDPVTLAWTATDAHPYWLQAVLVDAACKAHTIGGNWQSSGTSSAVVDSAWAEGPVRLRQVQLFDDAGNFRVYEADGTTRSSFSSNGPSTTGTHGFDFAGMSLTTYATGADTDPPVLTSIGRESPAAVGEGSAVSYSWSATDASGVQLLAMTFRDTAGKSHVAQAAPASQVSTTIDASWAPGAVAVDAVELLDTKGNRVRYLRDGSTRRDPTCGPDGTHGFDLSTLDFDVQPSSPPDTTAPSVVASAFASPLTLESSALLRWSGSDAGTGVASYDVAYRTATATRGFPGWTQPAAWHGLTTTATTASVAKGSTLCFVVRARDHAGNVSAWSASRCVTRAYDDSVLRPSTGWFRVYHSSLYGGSALHTTRYGSSAATGTVTVRHVAVVATTCASCGKVVVEVGGHAVATVSLVSSTTRRGVLLAVPLSSTWTGVVRLRVVSSSRNIEIDGLVLSRV